MKLRVGGKYKTRGGDTVEIINEDNHPTYPFSCLDNSYTEYGFLFEDETHSLDLIKEVFEEDEQVIASVTEATSKAKDDTKETYIKILEAMLTQDQLDTAGRILGNLSKQ